MALKKDNLKEKKDLALMQDLFSKRTELRNFRFAGSGSKSKNTRFGRMIRKDIARIWTELNSRKSLFSNPS